MAILQLNSYVPLCGLAALTDHPLAWYTDNAPQNDAQVAAHFSSKRPILGLCLKRYSYTADGRAIRLNTKIDIPVEIAVPHFIQDDKVEESNGLNSNFKLSLQAAVCHRGDSVDSGHYVALVRGTATPGSPARQYSHTTKIWMRFDDLAPQRITVVDIEKALKEETPYLLFYQIVPIEGDPGGITAGENSMKSVFHERNISTSEVSVSDMSVLTDTANTSGRPSFEITFREEARGRSPTENRRASVISFQDLNTDSANGANAGSLKIPGNVDPNSTPRPGSVSRSHSKSSDRAGGLGRTLSRLRRKSRENMPPPVDTAPPTSAAVLVKEAPVRTISVPERPKPLTQVNLAPHNHLQPTPKLPTLQPQYQQPKAHKHEKSHGRISRSKGRGEKPDRECIVM